MEGIDWIITILLILGYILLGFAISRYIDEPKITQLGSAICSEKGMDYVSYDSQLKEVSCKARLEKIKYDGLKIIRLDGD